ncbi:MAG: Holliday junction branch migration protein RuvA [Bifidobacteriaceae bacterium]|jgi:Holliday junction DNA helicase RuvA|nr:Holliday junction branch migration protein RuvA [Bifidobacteriaceae bacterium]
MIASVRGPVLTVTANAAVIECGGVGLAVTLTPAAREGLRRGEEATILTHLVVREDSLTLYGFADDAERDVFVVVQGVSGVGPRLALGLVSTLGAEGLTRAVAGEDVAALTKAPGIGRKGAQKLVISLAGKLAPAGTGAGVPGGLSGGAGVPGGGALGGLGGEVQAALERLGFSAQQSAAAVVEVQGLPDAPTEAAALLRQALQTLRTSR